MSTRPYVLLCVVTFVAGLLMSAGTGVAQQPAAKRPATHQPATAEDSHPGKKYYVQKGCYQCHGYQGQGGSAGPRLSTEMAFEGFAEIVRRPYGEMPAYSPKVLSDDQLRRMYDYLKSLSPPPDAASIPLLSGTRKP